VFRSVLELAFQGFMVMDIQVITGTRTPITDTTDRGFTDQVFIGLTGIAFIIRAITVITDITALTGTTNLV
jgi:hypothetical protein